MMALGDAGYHTVLFRDLIVYVEIGSPLPENPIVITFDDGHHSNIDIAMPILNSLGFCAEIAVIGRNIGESAGELPHFSLSDALSYLRDGTLEIGNHSYDMHQLKPRLGVYRMRGESEAAYVEAFTQDALRTQEMVREATGVAPYVYAYPYGYSNQHTEVMLDTIGIRVTLTVEDGVNTIIKGLPQSLRQLKRHNVTDDISAQQLLSDLKGLTT